MSLLSLFFFSFPFSFPFFFQPFSFSAFPLLFSSSLSPSSRKIASMAIPVTTRQPFQRFHYTLPPSLPTTPDSNSQTKRPRHRRLRVCTPEPNSLLSILRARPRVKLYTNPVIWTTLQPQLLSCKFVHRGRVPERSPDEPRIWGDSILARDYDMAREHSEKIMIVAEIVMACGGTDMG